MGAHEKLQRRNPFHDGRDEYDRTNRATREVGMPLEKNAASKEADAKEYAPRSSEDVYDQRFRRHRQEGNKNGRKYPRDQQVPGKCTNIDDRAVIAKVGGCRKQKMIR